MSNPFNYAPRIRISTQRRLGLSDLDVFNIRQWRAAGYKISAIAREYGLSLRDARWLTRGVKRVKEAN